MALSAVLALGAGGMNAQQTSPQPASAEKPGQSSSSKATQAVYPAVEKPKLDRIAEAYVKLALALGQHDKDYVDAYYGPPEWRKEAEAKKRPLKEIESEATALLKDLEMKAPRSLVPCVNPWPGCKASGEGPTSDYKRRTYYLESQLVALRARAQMLQGKKFSFDEEARLLYDAVPPKHTEAEFKKTIAELDKLLPQLGDGKADVRERYEAFRKQYVVPKDKLDTVFKAAIEACKARTLRHIQLPAGESFTLEYVTGKSWSGYNWYQGNAKSLIQINADLPIYIDRAIDLACHEGYPGHHVYNVLLEEKLVNQRGWFEFQVYPLFSPQSLIAEGSANYGIHVAFPGDERVEFEKVELFPLAGIEASKAGLYYQVQQVVDQLAYAGNEVARQYLNGKIGREKALQMLMDYTLRERAAAEQRLRFTEQYRAYVINYNLGKDLVKQWVERRAQGDEKKRWMFFERLLSEPILPSELTGK